MTRFIDVPLPDLWDSRLFLVGRSPIERSLAEHLLDCTSCLICDKYPHNLVDLSDANPYN
jgi:hypothetical protein